MTTAARATSFEATLRGTAVAPRPRVRISSTVCSALTTLLFIGCSGSSDGPSDGGNTTDAGTTDAGQDAGSIGRDARPGGSDGGADGLTMCPPGAQLRHYALTPPSSLPSPSMLAFTNLPQGTQVVGAANGLTYNMRFDVCESDGDVSLRGALYLGESFEPAIYYRWDDTITVPQEQFVELPQGFVYEQRVPPSRFIVEGLAEALQGNLQPLRIRFAVESGMVILGHSGFVALARGRVTPTSIEYQSIFVVVGGLAENDPFTDLPCRFEETTLTRTFTLATATFEVEACTSLGGGHTTAYRITSLAVTDTSAELTPAERQRHEFPTKPDVDRVLNYVWNHHNACDSFHLALDHADYAASTAPLAGCGNTVPNAPPRTHDEDPSNPVRYRIRYHGGPWVEGSMTGCTHYLFCR